jgi:hypothetical protein
VTLQAPAIAPPEAGHVVIRAHGELQQSWSYDRWGQVRAQLAIEHRLHGTWTVAQAVNQFVETSHPQRKHALREAVRPIREPRGG